MSGKSVVRADLVDLSRRSNKMIPRPQTMLSIAFFALLLFGAMTRTAYAYLDPGTGSMMLQLLLGGIAGSAVVLKLYWYKFKAVFLRLRAKQVASGDDATS